MKNQVEWSRMKTKEQKERRRTWVDRDVGGSKNTDFDLGEE